MGGSPTRKNALAANAYRKTIVHSIPFSPKKPAVRVKIMLPEKVRVMQVTV